MDIIMWLIIGVVILAIAIVTFVLFRAKKVSFIEITKLISKLLCQFCVVFLTQDVIYAVLTEHFHNRATASTNNTATTNTDHLIGLFNGNFWENEWFWLILIVSLTFYFSQVCKLRYKTIRDSQNKDSIEKLKEIAKKNFNSIEDFKEQSESVNCDIEKFQERKKVKSFRNSRFKLRNCKKRKKKLRNFKKGKK